MGSLAIPRDGIYYYNLGAWALLTAASIAGTIYKITGAGFGLGIVGLFMGLFLILGIRLEAGDNGKELVEDMAILLLAGVAGAPALAMWAITRQHNKTLYIASAASIAGWWLPHLAAEVGTTATLASGAAYIIGWGLAGLAGITGTRKALVGANTPAATD